MATSDKFQTYKNVFDEKTLLVLAKLEGQGYFDEIKSPISIGKEANVFSAIKKDGTYVCIKIYRTFTADFKRMYRYISSDQRFKGLQKKRMQIIRAWAQREYRNLLLMHELGINAPIPYIARENVLVMEFIGDKLGNAAKRLKDDTPKKIEKFSKILINDLAKMAEKNFFHGDLSEFNILNYKDRPILIDFSHGMKIISTEEKGLFIRDINTIKKYFSKHGCKLKIPKILQ